MAFNLCALALAAILAAAPTPAAQTASPGAPRAVPPGAGSALRPFVDMAAVDRTILHDIRYAQAHNFVGRPIRGYVEPRCLLSRRAGVALRKVQAYVRARGYSLKVYDCYRPRRAVQDFATWAANPADTRMKAEFYPRVPKSRLFRDGYLAHRSGHSRGSTVDLTLVKLPAAPVPRYVPGQPLRPCFGASRFPDTSIDMGTGYDCFDPTAATMHPRVTGRQRANRLLLRQVMTAAGFTNYPAEWWHYTLKNEPHPNTYFNFPVARSALPR